MLTPFAALFVLAGVLPVAAFVARERRAAAVRALLRLPSPRRAAALAPLVALVLLVALVATAAAQPVVVRQRELPQRSDVQGFVVFDTSLSMQADGSRHGADRLERAKRLAIRLERALPDVPLGIASMTDRALPHLMPTVDEALFARTVHQAIGIDRPPPSQAHTGRATTFDALVPLVQSHFFPDNLKRRLLVVLTDGEAVEASPLLRLTFSHRVSTLFVHVWQPGEHIYLAHGRIDPRYVSDPSSGRGLQEVAHASGGTAVGEKDVGAMIRAARADVGTASTHEVASGYARVALAPWFVLAAAVPLAFLLWRRNV